MQEYGQEKGSERAPADWDEADLPDPWDGDHTIEYWVWNGERLMPATAEECAAIQERERLQSARRRLARWQQEGFATHPPHSSAGIFAGIRQALLGVWHFWHLRREHGER